MNLPLVRHSFATLAAVACAVGLTAAELGRSRVVSTVGARLERDSNIFLNSTEVADSVFTADAGVRMIHDVSEITSDIGVGVIGQYFFDHHDQNAFDPSIDARIGYIPSEKTQVKLAGDFRRSSLANDALNDRTSSRNLTLTGSWEHLTTEKFGVRTNAAYHKGDYSTRGYSDVADYSVGVEAVYVYSPKLRSYAGYTWGESWTANRAFNRRNAGGKDKRYSLGFEGELSPKLTGDLHFGVTKREFTTVGFGDDSAFFIASRLSWAAAEKTIWTLAVDQDLNVTAADQSTKNLSATLVVTQQLAEKMSLEGSLGYTKSKFSTFGGAGARNDDGTSARLRLNYALNENASLDASAGVRNNNSTLAISDYRQVNFGAGVTYRF